MVIINILITVFVIYAVARYLLPALMRWLAQWIIRRQVNSFFSGFENMAGAASPGRQPNRQQRKRKIFDKADGEYVEYEEVTRTTVTETDGTSQTTSSTTEVTEQQIIDAEWEDIL